MNAVAQLGVFYGGTFDPIHDGHLAIARAAHEVLQAEIHVLPAADPPHRAPPGASAVDRAAMVELAIADAEGLLLDTRELQRGGRSWSIDTLHALREEFGPTRPLAWLVGADSFRSLPTWKRWRDLFRLTHFVVAARPGSSLDAGLDVELSGLLAGRWTDDPSALLHAPAGQVLRLEQPLQAHSASDLRLRIAAGLPWQHLVPAAVAGYIIEHRLYGDRGQPPRGRASAGPSL